MQGFYHTVASILEDPDSNINEVACDYNVSTLADLMNQFSLISDGSDADSGTSLLVNKALSV